MSTASAQAATAVLRTEAATAVLRTEALRVGYGLVPVVHDLDLHVVAGEVVALLGPNGAGKSTTVLALAGALRPLSGQVFWQGAVTRNPLHRRCRDGLAFVPEERSVIPTMTVRQNLRIARVEPVGATALFPELIPHLDRRAGLLSGGQQQILTLARALARRPRALLADELSLGLAPQVVTRLLQAVRRAADSGVAVLLVEQHVRKALAIADRVYVLQQGRITWSGTAAEATAARDDLEASFLGGTSDPADPADPAEPGGSAASADPAGSVGSGDPTAAR